MVESTPDSTTEQKNDSGQYPEYREMQQWIKLEPKDFLATWAKQKPNEDKLMKTLRFMRAARQKKMTVFTDTTMQLTKPHADHV